MLGNTARVRAAAFGSSHSHRRTSLTVVTVAASSSLLRRRLRINCYLVLAELPLLLHCSSRVWETAHERLPLVSRAASVLRRTNCPAQERGLPTQLGQPAVCLLARAHLALRRLNVDNAAAPSPPSRITAAARTSTGVALWDAVAAVAASPHPPLPARRCCNARLRGCRSPLLSVQLRRCSRFAGAALRDTDAADAASSHPLLHRRLRRRSSLLLLADRLACVAVTRRYGCCCIRQANTARRRSESKLRFPCCEQLF